MAYLADTKWCKIPEKWLETLANGTYLGILSESKYFWKPSKSCHVGIHWKALVKYFQMTTHVPGFPDFYIGQVNHQQHKGYVPSTKIISIRLLYSRETTHKYVDQSLDMKFLFLIFQWCYAGKCETIEERPMQNNGQWGQWGAWSECTRTCGAGISLAERHCNNPP